jgi:endonuclease/exonuclease/phosphatase family metal-dependent hydrolase
MRSFRSFLPIAVALATAALFVPFGARAETARIVIDGDFSDWDNIDPVHLDPAGDQDYGSIDFGRLWIANDKDFVFLSFEVGSEINLQDDNEITLYIDTDRKAKTGLYIRGLGRGVGADVEWTFGEKKGYTGHGTKRYRIYHEDIGLVQAPSYSSTRFEIAVRLPVLGRGAYPLSYSLDWDIVLVDKSGGDRMPDNETIRYVSRRTSPMFEIPVSLRKADGAHLRLLTYNVRDEGLFYLPAQFAHGRILKALRPDIIGYQEVWSHTAEETEDLVRSFLPEDPDGTEIPWEAVLVDPDVVIVSRYPVVSSFEIQNNGGFLLDLSEDYEQDLFLVVAHLPYGQNNEDRQWEADEIMAFIRDAKDPGGMFDLEEGTPIVIMGDLNLVGYYQQLKTFLSGDIVNTDAHGPSFMPDWDGTDLTDLVPLHTHLPLAFTWYSERSPYPPGRLDYFIYSDSVLEVAKSFVLWTPAMPGRVLLDYGLGRGDSMTASDHLPIVCDLDIPVTP